eukprot:Unigene1782_Nuclearia_a/m.5535 Unigene1782_Nuclearia_a/g.5535  ORF Unigene1782_Nuclearia_a/g.5535 Unigene1782_Nuclearia_a/m.5535 type:complete len:386 (+) Unigene1782_Nuclearia_a:1028-2185(+)
MVGPGCEQYHLSNTANSRASVDETGSASGSKQSMTSRPRPRCSTRAPCARATTRAASRARAERRRSEGRAPFCLVQKRKEKKKHAGRRCAAELKVHVAPVHEECRRRGRAQLGRVDRSAVPVLHRDGVDEAMPAGGVLGEADDAAVAPDHVERDVVRVHVVCGPLHEHGLDACQQRAEGGVAEAVQRVAVEVVAKDVALDAVARDRSAHPRRLRAVHVRVAPELVQPAGAAGAVVGLHQVQHVVVVAQPGQLEQAEKHDRGAERVRVLVVAQARAHEAHAAEARLHRIGCAGRNRRAHALGHVRLALDVAVEEEDEIGPHVVVVVVHEHSGGQARDARRPRHAARLEEAVGDRLPRGDESRGRPGPGCGRGPHARQGEGLGRDAG